MKPDRFSTQSYRLPRHPPARNVIEHGKTGALASVSRLSLPWVGVLALPPDLDALALLSGEDAEAVVLDPVQPVGSGGRGARVRAGGRSGAACLAQWPGRRARKAARWGLP